MRIARQAFGACMLFVFGPALTLAIPVQCSGSFADDEAANHFTANCAAAVVLGSNCALTVSSGYAAGSVMCSRVDGVIPKTYAYVTRPAIKVPAQHFMGSSVKFDYMSTFVKADRSDQHYSDASGLIDIQVGQATPRSTSLSTRAAH